MAEAEKGILTVCYPSGGRLDEAYYTSKHAEVLRRCWGPLGLERTEVRRITAAADGSAPPYQIIWTGYFPSAAALAAALQDPVTQEVLGDVQNYYDGAPAVFIGEAISG